MIELDRSSSLWFLILAMNAHALDYSWTLRCRWGCDVQVLKAEYRGTVVAVKRAFASEQERMHSQSRISESNLIFIEPAMVATSEISGTSDSGKVHLDECEESISLTLPSQATCTGTFRKESDAEQCTSNKDIPKFDVVVDVNDEDVTKVGKDVQTDHEMWVLTACNCIWC